MFNIGDQYEDNYEVKDSIKEWPKNTIYGLAFVVLFLTSGQFLAIYKDKITAM